MTQGVGCNLFSSAPLISTIALAVIFFVTGICTDPRSLLVNLYAGFICLVLGVFIAVVIVERYMKRQRVEAVSAGGRHYVRQHCKP